MAVVDDINTKIDTLDSTLSDTKTLAGTIVACPDSIWEQIQTVSDSLGALKAKCDALASQ
jgi:hypothetical protein